MEYMLYALRKERGLTQSDMAKKLGISRKTYQRKEVSDIDFKLSEAIEISKILKKPVEEIFLH